MREFIAAMVLLAFGVGGVIFIICLWVVPLIKAAVTELTWYGNPDNWRKWHRVR